MFPGETLQVEMWRVGPDTVVFQTRVKERGGAVALSSAGVRFVEGALPAQVGAQGSAPAARL